MPQKIATALRKLLSPIPLYFSTLHVALTFKKITFQLRAYYLNYVTKRQIVSYELYPRQINMPIFDGNVPEVTIILMRQ